MKRRFYVPILLALLPLALAGCSEATKAVEEANEMIDDVTQSAEEMAHPGGGEHQESSGHTKPFSGSTGKIDVGQTLEKNGVKVTLKEIILSDDPGLFSPPPEGMVFLYPVFTIENNIPEQGVDLYFSSGPSCKVYVDGGEEYSFSMDALFAYEGDVHQLDIDVAQGKTVDAMSGFVIPADWKSLEFKFERGFDPRIEPLEMSFTVNRDGSAS